MVKKIHVVRLDSKATLPTRAHPEDAGLDLYSCEPLHLGPGFGTVIRTGIALEIPQGHVGMIADRSSLGKKGLKTAGGIIDAGYRGEIGVIVWNISKEEIQLEAGQRVAQLLILPISTPEPFQVDELSDTPRGAGGFGSTGQ